MADDVREELEAAVALGLVVAAVAAYRGRLWIKAALGGALLALGARLLGLNLERR